MNDRHDTDEDLMGAMRAALARGDARSTHGAFERLLVRHQHRVLGRLLLKLPGDRAADVTQEVFLALFEAGRAGKEIGNVRAWLNRVAAHKTADFYRGSQGAQLMADRAAVQLDDDRPDGAHRDVPDQGELGRVEADLVVEQLLDRRSGAHRAVVCGYVIEGRPADEVAAETGETAANVYQVAKRFRDELRAALGGADVHPPKTTGPQR